MPQGYEEPDTQEVQVEGTIRALAWKNPERIEEILGRYDWSDPDLTFEPICLLQNVTEEANYAYLTIHRNPSIYYKNWMIPYKFEIGDDGIGRIMIYGIPPSLAHCCLVGELFLRTFFLVKDIDPHFDIIGPGTFELTTTRPDGRVIKIRPDSRIILVRTLELDGREVSRENFPLFELLTFLF